MHRRNPEGGTCIGAPLRTLLVISISEWGSKKKKASRRGNNFYQISLCKNARLLIIGMINLIPVVRYHYDSKLVRGVAPLEPEAPKFSEFYFFCNSKNKKMKNLASAIRFHFNRSSLFYIILIVYNSYTIFYNSDILYNSYTTNPIFLFINFCFNQSL